MKLAQIANLIDAHLTAHEADREWNRFTWTDSKGTVHTQRRLYHAGAGYHGGARVSVGYVSYQGRHNLTKAEALAYLAWLDAGNRGRHWDQQREEPNATS